MSILIEPFQIKISTRVMSISMVKLLMRLKLSHIVINALSTITRRTRCNHKEMLWNRLRARSSSHGKRKVVTSFKTLRIDF